MAAPLASSRITAPKASTFRSIAATLSCLRYTGIAPVARTNHPSFRSVKRGAFARNRTRRPAMPDTTTGSTRELGWFATMRTGPSGGMAGPSNESR